MTDGIVIDTNVFIISLLDESKLNLEEERQRPSAITYINGLSNGDYEAHLPTIAMVEICGVSRWKAGPGEGLATAIAIKNRLEEWVSLGLVNLYDLDQDRMRQATDLVIQHNLSRRRSLSAPDAIFIGLAEELGVHLVSFEGYFKSISDRAVVPV